MFFSKKNKPWLAFITIAFMLTLRISHTELKTINGILDKFRHLLLNILDNYVPKIASNTLTEKEKLKILEILKFLFIYKNEEETKKQKYTVYWYSRQGR